MLTLTVNKELNASIKLSDMDVEIRVAILPQGEVELHFTPWTQWTLSGESFDQLVEDYNLLKAHIRLCMQNQSQEELRTMPRARTQG